MSDMDTSFRALKLDERSSLADLFDARCASSPDSIAYQFFSSQDQAWHQLTWSQMQKQVQRWKDALSNMPFLNTGDRIGLLIKNGPEWVCMEQAALHLGLVIVPLFYNDHPGNVSYIIAHAGIKLLLLQDQEQWASLASELGQRLNDTQLSCILSIDKIQHHFMASDQVMTISSWLEASAQKALNPLHDTKHLFKAPSRSDIATIVYTSGTTGRPKGVVLSHGNILWNIRACLDSVACEPDDHFLSFLPISHMLERTVGYYLPMAAGAQVTFNRGIPLLPDDLAFAKPTIIVSVPRIYERMFSKINQQLSSSSIIKRALFALCTKAGWKRFQYQQGHRGWHAIQSLFPLLKPIVANKILKKLGGRLRVAICGGAALSPDVAECFLAMGLPILQGYGLTETSPVLSVNRLDQNHPESVGLAQSDVELRISDTGELQARCPGVMQGYWENPEATKDSFTEDGWLKTGDLANLDTKGFIRIQGRSKEVLVLANGEMVSPTDVETAITLNPLFEQAMVIGDNRPCLTALIVLEQSSWEALMKSWGRRTDPKTLDTDMRLHDHVMSIIDKALKHFPGYVNIRQFTLLSTSWSVENHFLTPTLKLKRNVIQDHFEHVIESMYQVRRHQHKESTLPSGTQSTTHTQKHDTEPLT